MEFSNEFTIPMGVDEAFSILTDLERVAPCMPGATLEGRDGDDFTGAVKVKVGPMTLTYAGTAVLTDVDAVEHTARIAASGRERRGTGNASAKVRATLVPANDGSLVQVTTDLDVSGKAAQFGRGVMADVGSRIIDEFAANLRDMLAEEGLVDTTTGPTTDLHTVESPRSPAKGQQQNVLNLTDLTGDVIPRGVGFVLGAMTVLIAAALLRRRVQKRRRSAHRPCRVPA